MSLPTLKKHVYASMAPEKKNTNAMVTMEAMMNIMQTTFTVLQSSPVLEDTLSGGRKTFLGLLSCFVTDTVKMIIVFMCAD